MSREAFEAEHCGGNKHTTRRNEHGDYVLPSVQDAWAGWQAALAWAYEDAARVCDGMHPEVWPSAYAEAIRERAKEVTK